MDLYGVFASAERRGARKHLGPSPAREGFINASSCYPCKVVKRMASAPTAPLLVTINTFGFTIARHDNITRERPPLCDHISLILSFAILSAPPLSLFSDESSRREFRFPSPSRRAIDQR